MREVYSSLAIEIPEPTQILQETLGGEENRQIVYTWDEFGVEVLLCLASSCLKNQLRLVAQMVVKLHCSICRVPSNDQVVVYMCASIHQCFSFWRNLYDRGGGVF